MVRRTKLNKKIAKVAPENTHPEVQYVVVEPKKKPFKRTRNLVKTIHSFVVEFLFMREADGKRKPSATKTVATIFCSIAAWGFIAKFTGSAHVTSFDLTVLSGLATAFSALYQTGKQIRLSSQAEQGVTPPTEHSETNEL